MDFYMKLNPGDPGCSFADLLADLKWMCDRHAFGHFSWWLELADAQYALDADEEDEDQHEEEEEEEAQ